MWIFGKKCSRCGRRYKAEGKPTAGGMYVTRGDPASQPVAFRCARCGNVYCQRCAKYELKSIGDVVITADFELCCDCGSTNFQQFPVSYS